jgi:hypothetical protein
MLRETKGLEEAGFSVCGPATLSEGIRIVEDGFTVTSKHVSLSKVAHEASHPKCFSWPCSIKTGHVLVGLELDALATAQAHLKDVLLVGGLRVRKGESRELGRQAAFNTPFSTLPDSTSRTSLPILIAAVLT